MNPSDTQKIRLRRLAYLAGFFLNFSLALSAYVNSSFLETFVAGHRVGLIYSLAAALTIIVSLMAPAASPLIATLMFCNLLRESGAVERLSKAAQNEIANVATMFLGLVIGSTMVGDKFLKLDTLLILGIGLLAFILDTAGGVLFGKIMYVLSGKKFNPLIGAAGISAFPMSARIVQRLGQEYDFENFLLMHAMGANAAGQLSSVIAGGVVLALLAGTL